MAQAALTLDRVATLTSDALRNKWLQGTALATVAFVVYFISSDLINPYNQYERLADSMLHGRLDIPNPPDYLELARYPDGAYVINPPAPAVFLIPFVAMWGFDTNEVIVSMAVGAAAAGLFWVATRQMGWDIRLSVALTLVLAFGTNFWWAAADGGMWMIAHVVAVFFMMGALVEATGAKRPWLVGLLVGAAGLARLPTFLTFPFFAYLLVDGDRRPLTELLRDRAVLLRFGLFAGGLAAMAALDLLYNYERYGSFRDEGYYHPQYQELPSLSHGMNDDSYIPRHLEAIFLKLPVLDSEFPFFHPRIEGLGLFFTTPLFIYIFGAPANRLTIAAAVAALLTLIPTVTYGATGGTQFGYRYALDVLPLLLLLTAAGMGFEMSRFKWGLVAVSCLIGLWGVLAFERFEWVYCNPEWFCDALY
jgi:hypothetical protein